MKSLILPSSAISAFLAQAAVALLVVIGGLVAAPLAAQQQRSPQGLRPFTIAPSSDDMRIYVSGAGTVAYEANALVVRFNWISVRNSPASTGPSPHPVAFLEVSLADTANTRTIATSQRVPINAVIPANGEIARRDVVFRLPISEMKEDFVIWLKANVKLPDGLIGNWPGKSQAIPIAALTSSPAVFGPPVARAGPVATGTGSSGAKAVALSPNLDADLLAAKVKALTAESIPGLKQKAEAGDASSQLMLGWAYRLGTALKKDNTEAFRWFRRSAEQGNACAQSWLGYMYQAGQGVTKDLDAAVKWYRAGAGQGCARAEGLLGHLYFEGEGIPKDREEGLRRMRRAAELGDSWSQAEMGYHAGEETKDYAEAAKWYRLAADEDEWAAYRMGYLYENGLGFTKDLSEALNWYRKAAAKDFSDAQFKVAEMYARGQGVPRDETESMKWYRKAADNGHNLSKFIAATQYKPTGYETVTVGSGFQARGSGTCKWASVGRESVSFDTGISFSIEDKYSDAERLIREPKLRGAYYDEPANPPQYRRLSDGTELWWGTSLHMKSFLNFIGYARRSGTLYRAGTSYKDARGLSAILDCFFAIAPTLGRVSTAAQLADPVYGDRIDFPGEWSNGDISRRGGFTSSRGAGKWIDAGRLNGYATDVESAMAMVEAKVRQMGGKLGSRQTLSFSGGQALWAEAQGGEKSFYGAVARGGRFYYVYIGDPYGREVKPEHRQAFLATLQSIRP